MSKMTMLQGRGAMAVRASARTLFVFLIALTLGGLPQLLTISPALAAEEPTSLTNVQLWIYPEYDDPRLLVMLEGKLPQGTKIPATVRFLVPQGAEMYSAGSIDSKGTYKGGPPDRKPSSVPGWDEISYDLSTDTFRVEYYHDNIQGLPDKTIAYEFRTLYPIDALTVEVLQPLKATNFSTSPAAQNRSTSQNMQAYGYRYTNVGVEKPLSFNVSYTKADTVPSLKPQQAGTTAEANPNLMWMLGLAGAAVIAAGAFWYVSNKRRYRPVYRGTRAAQRPATRAAATRTPVSQTAQRAARGGGGRQVPKADNAYTFCRKCGARLEGTAKFCNRCGTGAE